MKKFFKGSYFAIIVAFLYIPIAVMILFSFNSGGTVFSWTGFDFSWYAELFKNSPFIKSIITSLFVAIVSTVISLIIGVSAAIGLSKTKCLTQKSWFGVANVPLINADVVTAVSLMIVFLLSGIKFGIGTLIMAHISFNVPYVLITVMPRLRKIDPSIIEAGLDLGAKPSQVLFRVILPVLKPAIIAAAAIAFAMSFDDFIISYFTGGSQTNVSTFIYTAKKVKPFIFAFGTILVAVIALAIIGWNAISLFKQQQTNKIEKLKNNTYKIHELSKVEKRVLDLEMMIKSGTKIGYSKRLSLWVKYWILKARIKIVSARNYDKKISRLEWKQYKIKSAIRKEQRYYSRQKIAKKRLRKLENQLAKTKDIKKAARLTLQIEKIQQRLEFLQSEIEWIENRDELTSQKLKKIQNEINTLKRELQQEEKPSKKTIARYNKKIKNLETYKIEVAEGKNHYKLRLVVERLKELRTLNYDHILVLNTRLDKIEKKVFIQKSFTPKLDRKILKTTNPHKVLELTKIREVIYEKIETKLMLRIERKNQKLEKLQSKIQKEKLKLLPQTNDSNEKIVHTRGFLGRSWKVIGTLFLTVAAFSGLTVAYVFNNVYDLVIGNWGEYIDPELIGEFEKEYKVKVNYQTYDSNETLYNKLYTFNYDLMIPSDYMVQKLALEKRIEAIDYDKVKLNKYWDTKSLPAKQNSTLENPKIDLNQQLVDVLKASTFTVDGESKNLLDYSVPYFWGDLVIVVNPTTANKDFLAKHNLEIDENDKDWDGMLNQEQLSWNLLWEAAKAGKRVALNSDPKNIFMAAAQRRYQKVNLTTTSEIDALKKDFQELILRKNVSLNGDELMDKVGAGNFDFAMMYSGDATYSNRVYNGQDADDKQPTKTKFIFGRPNKKVETQVGTRFETTNVFAENMVISQSSSSKELAYKFINFVLEKSAEISEYVGTASPYQQALEELTNSKDGIFRDYKTLYEPVVMGNYNLNKKPNSENFEPLNFEFHSKVDDYLIDQFNNIVAGKIG